MGAAGAWEEAVPKWLVGNYLPPFLSRAETHKQVQLLPEDLGIKLAQKAQVTLLNLDFR